VGEYRSKGRRRGYHWSERSLWNPRRWLAAPMIVASLGTLATVVGVVIQMIEGGLSWWGAAAVLGTLVTVGAIAWTQSDLRYLKTRERNRNL
jgi:hypothetical protein